MRKRSFYEGLCWSAAAGALLVAALGCGPKVIRTPVYENGMVEVYLRHRARGDDPVDMGFDHPAVVAPVRVTQILARIERRGTEGEDRARAPALPSGILFAAGEGVSKSLGKADPSQEVVVMARERKRNLGIFTEDRLTTLVVWMHEDRLFVHVGQIDEPVSLDPRDKPPEPKTDVHDGDFRLIASDGMVPVGPQTVAAAWRDPIFRTNSALRVRPGGEIVRRTVLFESTPAEDLPDDAEVPSAIPPDGLSPEALRGLADLEEERRRGEMSESEYQTRRREILGGTLPED